MDDTTTTQEGRSSGRLVLSFKYWLHCSFSAERVLEEYLYIWQ